MEIAFLAARNGLATCRSGKAFLHSAYDPAAEAGRFLDAFFTQERTPREGVTYIIAGPCLDYLSRLIKDRCLGSFVIGIQFASAFRGREQGSADLLWYPDDPIPLQSLLLSVLDDDRMGRITILEWAPAVAQFPKEAESMLQDLRIVLDRISNSAATTRSEGRRWIRNACRSFLLLGELLEVEPEEAPVLVVGAGPTLNRCLPSILAHREKLRIVAASSSLAALRGGGIEPDLLVSTDGGFWSRAHLYPLAGKPLVLASPLTALPSASLESAILLLDQGWFPETELASKLGSSYPVPAHGTVTGTALALAASLSSGPVIVAGFDFAAAADGSHARPHAFDDFTLREEGRRRPGETLRWQRLMSGHPEKIPGTAWRTSRSLAAYAAAIERDAVRLEGGAFRLVSSPIGLRGFTAIDGEGFAALLKTAKRIDPCRFRSIKLPRGDREGRLAAEIENWTTQARISLGFMESGKPPDPRMGELFRSVDLPD
ncbi:MAG: 6-hydroxymethylpterin diphosphokinase MptE-like protein, partial [Spirochaetota bacterium]